MTADHFSVMDVELVLLASSITGGSFGTVEKGHSLQMKYITKTMVES